VLEDALEGAGVLVADDQALQRQPDLLRAFLVAGSCGQFRDACWPAAFDFLGLQQTMHAFAGAPQACPVPQLQLPNLNDPLPDVHRKAPLHMYGSVRDAADPEHPLHMALHSGARFAPCGRSPGSFCAFGHRSQIGETDVSQETLSIGVGYLPRQGQTRATLPCARHVGRVTCSACVAVPDAGLGMLLDEDGLLAEVTPDHKKQPPSLAPLDRQSPHRSISSRSPEWLRDDAVWHLQCAHLPMATPGCFVKD
jgi:hypothetical protein